MAEPRRFVLVTGMSGAGKSQALRFLEDLGFYCVDNLPPALIPTLADLVVAPAAHPQRRIAVCIDARASEELQHLPAYLDEVAERGVRPDAVFLDSSDDVILRRYSETRRRHPNAPGADVEAGITRERELLAPMRARADLIIDTSAISVAELRLRIEEMFREPAHERELLVTVMSFGFKNGLPPAADLVFDVRFLPNPHYVDALRPRTGVDPDVRDYVMDNDDARAFIARLEQLLDFLLPRYRAELKSYLTLAIGCTGGRHRSVAVANHLAHFIRGLSYDVRLRHRDVDVDD
jgi:UPF0042 nucleotide-binding protein